MLQYYTDIAVKHAIYCTVYLYQIVLKHPMYVCSIINMHSITVITIFLLKCCTQTCSIDLTTNGKAYIDCYFDVSIHCTTQPASLLLCFLCQGGCCCWRGYQGWKAFEKVGSVFIPLTYTFCSENLIDRTTLHSNVSSQQLLRFRW